MVWFYILAIGFFIGYILGRRLGISDFVKTNTIGSLRVDRPHPNGPLVFMEVDPGFQNFAEMDVVILKVKHEDFIPRK